MKKHLIFLMLFICNTLYGQIEYSFKPNFIPIRASYSSSAGLKLTPEASISIPYLGTFTISGTQNLIANRYNKNINTNDLILIFRDSKKTISDRVYHVKGKKSFEINTKGNIKFEVENGTIIIDVSNVDYIDIYFDNKYLTIKSPNTYFNNVWIEHNITCHETNGMLVHYGFTILEMEKEECLFNLLLYDLEMNLLVNKSIANEIIVPNSDSFTVIDFAYFIPYWLFEKYFNKGIHHIQAFALIKNEKGFIIGSKHCIFEIKL